MVLSVQWKDFGRSQCITAFKIRQKIIKMLLPVSLKSLSQCTVEQIQWDAITEVAFITVMREKLFGRGCASTMSLLWWLCISTTVASHFQLKLSGVSWGRRIYILLWQPRNRKSKQKSQNKQGHNSIHPQLIPYLCSLCQDPSENWGENSLSSPRSPKKYFPSSKNAQRKCGQAQSLQSSRKEWVRRESWGSLALACPGICNPEKAEILLISLILFWFFFYITYLLEWWNQIVLLLCLIFLCHTEQNFSVHTIRKFFSFLGSKVADRIIS